MRSHLRTSIALTIAAAAALSPTAAHAAETTLAVEQRPFTVSSHGNAHAWSSYDARDGRYHLTTLTGGRAVRPGPSSPAPFDVDLGAGPDGETVAVYSRCAVPGRPPSFETGTPARGSDCDLYRFDFGSSVESRLRGVSSPHDDEREPSVDGDRIVFVRTERSRDGRKQDVLRRGSVTGRHASRRLFVAGTRLEARIDEAQVRGSRVAFVAGRRYSTCCFISKLFVLSSAGGRAREVYRAVSGGANAARIVTPTFDAGARRLFWARTNQGSGTGNRYVRRTLSTGRTAYAQGSSRIASTSWIGPGAGFATVLGNVEIGSGRLVLTGPVRFDARP